MVKNNLKSIAVTFLTLVIIASLFVYFVLIKNGSSYSESCTKSQVKPKVENVFFGSIAFSGSKSSLRVVIDDVNEVPLDVKNDNKITACEVVFHIEPVEKEVDEPVQKFILYTIGDTVITGNLWKYDHEKKLYVNVTFERLRDINKEYTQHMQEKFKKMEKFSQQREEIKKLAEKEFDTLVKQSDMKFETKNPKALTVSFIDPYCPHCKHMKEVLLKKVKEGKISAYFIFLPISTESEEIVASIICDKKTNDERLKAFNELYKSKKICDNGKNKVEKNYALFNKLKGEGVPYTIMKKGKEVEIIKGSVSENIFDSYLE